MATKKKTQKKTVGRAKTIIEVGGRYRIYSDAVKTHPNLPPGTYEVHFSMSEGHWLTRVEDMTPSPEKMYGDGQSRIDRIKTHYAASKRSVGVLLSGKGGMGKTMLMRSLAHQMSENFDLPVVIVSSSSPGLARFIDQLDECVVMFDEFEKIFTPADDASHDEQVQFLSLFDGMSATKRLYVVTVNDLSKVNAYMINRTGRFHYHLQFDYPKPQDVAEYLRDAGVKKSQIEKVVGFTKKTKTNYDHLRAIAFDLVVTGADFADIIGDLNIRRTNDQTYDITMKFVGGNTKTERARLDLFDEKSSFGVWLPLKESAMDDDRDDEYVRFTLDNKKAVFDADDVITYGPEAVRYDMSDIDKGYRRVESITLRTAPTTTNSYAGLI